MNDTIHSYVNQTITGDYEDKIIYCYPPVRNISIQLVWTQTMQHNWQLRRWWTFNARLQDFFRRPGKRDQFQEDSAGATGMTWQRRVTRNIFIEAEWRIYICVDTLNIIGSDNDLSPDWRNQYGNIVNLALRNELQWNFNRYSYIFIQEYAFENVVYEMAPILSRSLCVNVEFKYFCLLLWISNNMFHVKFRIKSTC